jgi:hypothetical protein
MMGRCFAVVSLALGVSTPAFAQGFSRCRISYRWASESWQIGRRGSKPVVHLLLGAYWKGSGVSDRDFESGRFALQVGGGVDLRRTGSVHAVRLSVDYRQVFETDAGRNQLRFLTAYVLGPPETKTPHPAPGR